MTFKKIAHAIPESIGGHKNLICNEECEECNEMLGAEVESHLCNWFEFRRCQSVVQRKLLQTLVFPPPTASYRSLAVNLTELAHISLV